MTMRVQFPTHPISGVTPGAIVIADPTSTSGIGFGTAPTSAVAPVTIASGYWWALANGVLGTLAGAGFNGYEFVYPFFVNQTQTVKALEVEVTVAASTGGTIRMGIRNNTTNGLPGTVMVDGGGAAATATGMLSTGTLGTMPTLTGGAWYWASLTMQGSPSTMPTVRTVSTGDARFPIWTNAPATNQGYWGYYQTGVTGALPSTFTAAGYLALLPRIWAQEN